MAKKTTKTRDPEKQKAQPVRAGLSQVLLVVMGRIELPTYGL